MKLSLGLGLALTQQEVAGLASGRIFLRGKRPDGSHTVLRGKQDGGIHVSLNGKDS